MEDFFFEEAFCRVSLIFHMAALFAATAVWNGASGDSVFF